MVLRRLGNKSRIAKNIQQYFPPHKIYIEPFFGAGGMFFNKPKAKYNFLNDLDSDVFNLFKILTEKKEELFDYIILMPESQDLFNYWLKNKEVEPIKKAARFLYLSNFSLLGSSTTFRIGNKPDKRSLENNLFKTYDFLINGCYSTKFLNFDFRNVLKNISFIQDGRNDEAKSFIYADPPYLDTVNNYSNGFTKQDSIDLFNILTESGIKFAMSEFDNPFIIEQAKQRNLNIIPIKERQNLKNRRIEILITNYENYPSLFD